MAIRELLSFSAESIAQGVISQLKWRTEPSGRVRRQELTPARRSVIQDRVESRMGRVLSATERRELSRIVDAADNASRRARQIDHGSRLPYAGEIERLPGTTKGASGTYTYTTVVSVIDMQTGLPRSFTHMVSSSSILSGDQVRAAVQEAVASGSVSPIGDTNVPQVGGIRVQGIIIQSIYEGQRR